MNANLIHVISMLFDKTTTVHSAAYVILGSLVTVSLSCLDVLILMNVLKIPMIVNQVSDARTWLVDSSVKILMNANLFLVISMLFVKTSKDLLHAHVILDSLVTECHALILMNALKILIDANLDTHVRMSLVDTLVKTSMNVISSIHVMKMRLA